MKQVKRKLQVSKPKQNKGRDVRVICLPKPTPANSAVSSQSRAQKLGPGLTGMWRPAVRGGRQLLASSSSLLSYSVVPPYTTLLLPHQPHQPGSCQTNRPTCSSTFAHPLPITTRLHHPPFIFSTPSPQTQLHLDFGLRFRTEEHYGLTLPTLRSSV